MGQRVEASPLFDGLIACFEEHGARTPQGWQIRQEELAELAGFTGKRHMYAHLRKMKEHGIVVATPQASGAGATLKRDPDIYHLRVSPEQWAELRGPLLERLEQDARQRMAHASRVAQMERSRLARIGARREAAGARAPAGPKPQPVPIDYEAVEALAATLDDDDLEGW